MSLPGIPNRQSEPKQKRTKTFTGCWTCRARRVKCDEHKPHCLRCRRGGHECQGYNVRLGWDVRVNANCQERVPRRQIRLAGEGPERRNGDDDALSADALEGILGELDRYSGEEALERRGPFSVFRVGSRARGINDMQVHGIGNQAKDIADVSNRQSAVGSSDTPGGSGSPATVVSTTTNPLLYPAEYPANDCIENYINPSPIPTPETELIHHWAIFLSENMLLIDTPDNPCRTIFMPVALQGLDTPDLDTSSSVHLAVFHAICAASAFSLFHLRNEPRYHSLAVQHDQHALCKLRRTLQLRGGRLDEPTLVAVLSCIAAEGMSGRKRRWRAHAAGVLGLLEKEVYRSWIRSPTAAPLLQSYLSLSSLCSLKIPGQLIALLRGWEEVDFYLERSHGVTRALIQLLAHITDIKESKKSVSALEVDQLELRLYLSFPRLSCTWITPPDSEVIQNALNSFYYATLIYFRRTLRNASVAEVQDLVEKGIQSLEAADAQKRGGCPYNWASFVIAVECGRSDLQARMLDVFIRKRRHGIRNTDRLAELVQIVWERRVSAAADVHWQDLAIESDFDIMFV